MALNLLTRPEAAEYLGLSPRTISRYIKRNRISHVRIGRRVLFHPYHLEDFVKSQTVQAGTTKTQR